jgi:hypothetical protein
MLAVQQQRAQQLAETEKKIKEILARRGEGEYDPNQQIVSFEGYAPTEIKDLDKMSKEELITISKGHIKKARSMKKDELLKALKSFIAANPGKILLGTEGILRDGLEQGEQSMEVEDRCDDNSPEVNEDIDQGACIDEERDTPIVDSLKSCSIMECDTTSVENLVWCSRCELWFCNDLHGPHKSHSAQTHLKEGRVRQQKNEEKSTADDEQQSLPTTNLTGKKRGSSALSDQPQENHDAVKVAAAVSKLKKILLHPSKTQQDELRSALNFTSYDISFLTMVAKDFNVDVSSLANKSRPSRLEVLEYLLSMLK